MRKNPKVIYYTDELNDEFSGDSIIPRRIDETYWYGDNHLRFKVLHFIFYKLLAVPFGFFYLKFKYAHKIINKKVLKPYKNKAYFMYANHTNNLADPFIPSLISFPYSIYDIVNANNVSMPVLGVINKYLGALPLPDNLIAARNFMDTIKLRISENKGIMIYPEAHIWPFYTRIRPFSDASFKYPVQFECPVFCFTNTYQKRRFSTMPRIVTYVDGPFFADQNLEKKLKKTELRNKVYNKMCERSLLNNVELIKYLPSQAQEENCQQEEKKEID